MSCHTYVNCGVFRHHSPKNNVKIEEAIPWCFGVELVRKEPLLLDIP